MRRLYTMQELRSLGVTRSALRWAVRKGRLTRVEDGIYGEGPADPTPDDRGRAAMLATGALPAEGLRPSCSAWMGSSPEGSS